MPISTVSAIVGVAKQTARGALAANPSFAHGVKGGAPISVEASQSALEVTTGVRASANVTRESVNASSDIQAPAYLKTLGLYLLGALGSKTTTGAGPYEHTFLTGDLPYLSVFAKGIGPDIEAVADAKIDELVISWEGANALEVGMKAMGTTFSYPASFTPGVDETGSESFLIPVGGTFKYDPIGSTLATARVVGGEITVKNNVAQIPGSASITPTDTHEGKQECEVKLTVVPDNLADFRKVITGAANGSAASASVPVGSVELEFKENNGGAGSLKVTGSKVAFMTELPEADPSGAAVELELVGVAVVPDGGVSPLTFVLKNAQATY